MGKSNNGSGLKKINIEFPYVTTKKKPRSDYRSLAIYQGEVHYAFTKYHQKTILDIWQACVTKNFTQIYTPLKEKAVLMIKLLDINDIEYNEAHNAVWIAGKFRVTYVDPRTGAARVTNYNDKLYCFEFPYVFADVDKFIQIVQANKAIIKNKEIPYPVSL